MRRRLARLLALAAFLALFAVLAPARHAAACSCMQLGPGEALRNADAGFIGVVVGVNDPSEGAPMVNSLDPIAYAFAVEERLKGPVDEGARVVVRSARDGAACGEAYAVGQRWRLHTHRFEGALWSGICSGNELLAENVMPVSPPDPPDAEAGPPAAMLIGAGSLLLVTVVSVVAFARTRPQSSR